MLDQVHTTDSGGWRSASGDALCLAQVLGHGQQLAAGLPMAQYAINVCENRHAFVASFVAALLRGQTTLLPAVRSRAVVDALIDDYGDCYVLSDHLEPTSSRARTQVVAPPDGQARRAPDAMAAVPPETKALIAFTSGSTGKPTPHTKTWAALQASAADNRSHALAQLPAGAAVLSTVPAQHMYGFELSVLQPLLGGLGLVAAQPFYPQDLLAALAACTKPTVLVTTPVHLRAFVRAGLNYPNVCRVISATAPLDAELAAAAEAAFTAPVHEVFGATETCVIAHRRTAAGTPWTVYDSVQLDGSGATAAASIPSRGIADQALPDHIQLAADGRSFTVLGRDSDVIKLAGKRASLADLNQHLLAIEGVEDGVLFQPGSGRLAALVVAPGLTARQLRRALVRHIDTVFLPRRVLFTQALPRNAVGKLPRAELLASFEALVVSQRQMKHAVNLDQQVAAANISA